MKKFFQSKTIWAGLATIMTGVGMYVSGEQSLQELVMASVGFIFIILRMVTSKAIITSDDTPTI